MQEFIFLTTRDYDEALAKFAQLVNYSLEDDDFNHPHDCCSLCSSDYPGRINGTWEKRLKLYKMIEKAIMISPSIHSITIRYGITPHKNEEIMKKRCIQMLVWFADASGNISFGTFYSFCRAGNDFFFCGPKNFEEIIKRHESIDEDSIDPGNSPEEIDKIRSMLMKKTSEVELHEKLLNVLENNAFKELPFIQKQITDNGLDFQKNFLEPIILRAAVDRKYELVKNILKYTNIDANASDGGGSILMNMCYRGQKDIVAELLNKGADVNMKHEAGTALMKAISGDSENKLEIVKILLNAGADVNLKNENGEHALITAAWDANAEIMKILLEKGADPDIQDTYWGYTALLRAADHYDEEQSFQAVKILLNHGASLNGMTKEGENVWEIVRKNGYDSILGLLDQKKSN